MDTIIYAGGEISRKCVSSASLKIRWVDGTEQILHEDRGYGHYSFVDGVISDIILTDIDGNGIADLSFTCSSKGKWVILFQKEKSFIKREIKRAVDVAVGGC